MGRQKIVFKWPIKINMYFLHASKRISELSLTNNYKTLTGFFIISSLSLVKFFRCTLSLAARRTLEKIAQNVHVIGGCLIVFLSQAVFSKLQRQAKKFSLIHLQQNFLKEPMANSQNTNFILLILGKIPSLKSAE
jgi:hypothetical protein